ncbi:MAG TPA: OmpH family outer membrane protein [Gemmatimonadota bacterium]|nr:OmpH family outer membrane protein [Gemmatimonadota bacterium]
MQCWKVLLGALTLGLVVPAAGNAQGQTSLKIGYIDSEEIIKAAPGYTEANDAFNRTAGAWRDTLDSKRTQLQTLFDDYKAQEVILSPEKKTEKQQEMLTLEQEIQQYFQAKFGQEGEAAAKQAELMKPIIDRVNDVIEETRREGSYALIFDLNDGALVAGDPALNITQQVIDRLRAQPAPSR